ncbi:MAG: aminoglycoside phosphotransferase family protein [Cyanobacteria bacterium K_Offshore_surface_m2_239]|nr:aminoglycoside phosphotransferase family protein [Cyanobacteria bacterium K_Offshore_surface_m2_239]
MADPDPRLLSIAAAFAGGRAVHSVRPLGNGNINATYRVDGAEGETFVLQRLNTAVFPEPRRVMANLLVVGRHVEERLRREAAGRRERRWVFPRVLTATNGEAWLETEGEFWRAISHVPRATSLDQLETPGQAREVGYGLGRFHALLHDLPCDQLADTLEGFHITPGYLAAYHALCRQQAATATATATAESRPGADPEREAWAHHFVARREALAGVLERAKAAGALPLRPIHGDPKVNNVLLDADTGQAVALIDLDTVKPGLVHYDIGDGLRSACNPLGEETLTPEAVVFDLDLCAALLEGYGAAAGFFLTPAEHDHLFDAIRLLSFELGLRFFSDHLAGNVYFHTARPGHNLDRALVQFHLTASIEAREAEIRGLLARLREGR